LAALDRPGDRDRVRRPDVQDLVDPEEMDAEARPVKPWAPLAPSLPPLVKPSPSLVPATKFAELVSASV
jgi:hypothetical protein